MLSGFLGSCTSARWTVQEKQSVDHSESEIVRENYFLQQSGEINSGNPVLSLELFTKTEYEYPQRVLVQRTIQDYQLRWGSVALGIGGATMAFYLANATDFGHDTSTKRWTLNGMGALMLASGFLNMKAVGDPQPTGEERYLRSTGTTTEIDTMPANSSIDTTASVYMLYNDLIIFEDNNQQLSNGKLNIPVGDALEDLNLSGANPGSVTVEVLFADSLYQYEYPIESVLQPYAVVNDQLTALRSSANENDDNVLADLVEGSELKINNINDEWYQVLYGISETYIKKSSADIIWRSEDYTIEDQVAVPRVPFGNVDVESNIPVLNQQNNNAKALLVVNQNYEEPLNTRNFAFRDGRLIRSYLENALGYKEEDIHQLADIPDSDTLNTVLSSIQESANDSTEFFVYFSGYGTIETQNSANELQLLTVPSEAKTDSTISLRSIFSEIGKVSSAKTIVLSDIDFSASNQKGRTPENQQQKIMEYTVSPLTDAHPNSSILFGARLNNVSGLYMSQGVEKMHHIFPYFFARALQERRTTISDIYQYLERNVSYTSRKLYDRPQSPLLFGNTQLNIVSE
ncbi:caspase family protein [Fodinibius sp. Rm-B-1B1-1]|uniref:caspase family protein n=1 Tax=Fodinibius alkaliphilus TaxID=3140241 RepID=UPI00315A1A00